MDEHDNKTGSQKQGGWTPIETRMLSGEPFTYSGLMAARAAAGEGGRCGDDDRVIDKTIQKLRRKGLISYTREGRKVVWRANPSTDQGEG